MKLRIDFDVTCRTLLFCKGEQPKFELGDRIDLGIESRLPLSVANVSGGVKEKQQRKVKRTNSSNSSFEEGEGAARREEGRAREGRTTLHACWPGANEKNAAGVQLPLQSLGRWESNGPLYRVSKSSLEK